MMVRLMRTTLDIDLDVLQPARALEVRNGVPLLPRRAPGHPRPTMTLVNRLRDEE